MRSRAGFALLCLVGPLLLALTLSCDDETPVTPGTSPDFSSPEAIVEQLQAAYRNRDSELYAELLATDFIFRFQPVDQSTNGEFWTRDQDSTGTSGLFLTPLVSTIRVALLHGPPEDPEQGFDSDVRRIRIHSVQLEVDQTDGTTLLVTDIQDMYFRPGREALEEDPGRWYMLEWRDIPSVNSSRPVGDSNQTTWGTIKSLYA